MSGSASPNLPNSIITLPARPRKILGDNNNTHLTSYLHKFPFCGLKDREELNSFTMASTSSPTLSISSSTSFIDKVPRQSPLASPQSVTLPTLPSPNVQSQNCSAKATAYCRKLARNVMAMATGEAPAEVAGTELPDIVKSVQEAWEKVEDKYAVTSLGVAGVVALWGTTGMISAIDRLPVVPGVLELVGIGYTGWFAYKNLVFKPEREALVAKIKDTYKDIIGSSS